ncbi:neuronal acetylcholine receptor subunit alpha-10-like isoform X1 [Zootermopsis nevadensis]|uniref:neuronal acetylcholine receptor subunit alpha-10-like isoform X1 n=2 Tax=Zootermopsis nevadensis TaxID=136037 RepID=UPI000B8E3918|nr:neuronal acetylcholine receptor subunit alpha-10-like isoform X1 [Zootermopsis nevadensis]
MGSTVVSSWLQHMTGLCALLCVVMATGVLGDEQEYRLTRYLMANYDPSVRPAENSSEPLKVVFGISLHHIIDVDEKNQILTTNCWLTQIWTDHHLKWNASDFAGIRVIRLPYQRVWRPDTVLYNNADSQYNSAVINTNVIVTYTGEVVWLSHGIFRSSCDINVEYFPFDVQSCNMKWASWTYDGYQLDLVKQTEDGDVTNYQANGEFDLVSFDAIRHVEFYSCCPEPYPDITYVIRLRRRPMFYVYNLILPCILINGIALLVFYVPSESGEKVTLGISALLSMTVFLMTIRESLPPTEKTPLISLYYGVSICLVSFASGLSVVTLNVYHRGVRGTGVPRMIKALILGKLAKLVFLQFEPRDKHRPSMQHQDMNTGTGTRLDCPRQPDNKWIADSEGDYLDPQYMSPRFLPRHSRADSTPDSFEAQFLRVLNKVNHTIERNELRVTEQEHRDVTEREWKQVALVCDRFLLWVFLLTTAVTTTVILCGSPYGP